MKILVIRVSAIGDVIHTLPAIFLLKQSIPNAQISWVIQKKASSVILDQPFLDKVWIVPDHYLSFQNIGKTFTILKEIRQTRWDAILDFQGLIKTIPLILALKGTKYGFDKNHVREKISSWFTNHKVTPTYQNIIQKNLTLASAVIQDKTQHVTCPTLSSLQKNFSLHLPAASQANVDIWIAQHALKNIIILCPNTTWPSKCWPLNHWKTLIHALIRDHSNHALVLIGKDFGADATELAHYIGQQELPVFLAPAWDLSTILYLLRHSKALIAPDTSFLHGADFLAVRAIGLFGPTSASMHGPFLTQENIKTTLQASCPHFYQKTHGAQETCMNQITPTMVLNQLNYMLNPSGKNS
jgi:lipopolysaccharide heptosyltransferase I